MKKNNIVFDFGDLNKIDTDSGEGILELIDAMLDDEFDCRYIGNDNLQLKGNIKRTSYEELKEQQFIDIWFSVNNPLPKFIQESPYISTYLLITKVFDTVNAVHKKTKENKIKYDLGYYSKQYEYLVFLDEENRQLFTDFYKIRANQSIDVIDNGYAENLKNRISRGTNLPLVTIITITYNLIEANRKETIAQCIESVKEQSYKNIEHIIIDGASSDGTLELLSKYQEDGDIQVYSEPDKGLYDAMNKGVKYAKGRYIGFLNSDDYYSNPRGVEYSVRKLEINGADYSFADALIINEDGTTFNWMADINNLAFATHYCHQSMIVKAEIFQHLGAFNLNYKVSADSDFMVRLYANKCKYVYIPCQIVNYRGGGVSAQNKEISQKDHSETFFKNIGCKLGITRTECHELWQFHFLNDMYMDQKISVLSRLSKEFDIDAVWIAAFNERSILRKIEHYLISTNIVVVRRKEKREKQYVIAYLFGVIPCFIKVKKVSSEL